jgi:hypothetical protein
MTKLSQPKGYSLIDGHKHGFHPFLSRNDLGNEHFPKVTVDSLNDNYWTKVRRSERWPTVRDMNWRGG